MTEEIEKEFIPHEQSLILKKMGFNEECMSVFSEEGKLSPLQNFPVRNSNVPSYCTAPIYRQVFKWFRENNDLIAFSLPYSETDEPPFVFIISIRSLVNNYDLCYDTVEGEECKTNEEAELACLKKLIELVKTKNK